MTGVATGKITALDIENLFLNVGSPFQAFNELVRMPLKAWCNREKDKRVVILVDGIDEAARYPQNPNIRDLLIGTEDFPDQVAFILTSRVEDERLRISYNNVHIRASDDDNRQDVKTYISLFLASNATLAQDSVLLDKLIAKADGNFLYAKYMLSSMESKPQSEITARIDSLPIGLEAFYTESMYNLSSGVDKNVPPSPVEAG